MQKHHILHKPHYTYLRYYDYNDCRDYIQEKFSYTESDMLDFFCWIEAELIGRDMDFDGFIKLWANYTLDSPKLNIIYHHFVDEFEDENGQVIFKLDIV